MPGKSDSVTKRKQVDKNMKLHVQSIKIIPTVKIVRNRVIKSFRLKGEKQIQKKLGALCVPKNLGPPTILPEYPIAGYLAG